MNNQYQNLGKETANKLNNLGFHVVESLIDIATPIISSVGGVNIPQANNSDPHCNIIENDNYIKILCLLPGVKKENINILLKNNQLEINAETNLGNDNHWEHIIEKKFCKNIKLRSNVKNTDLNVKFENGALKILVDKNLNSEEAAKINID